MPKSKKIKLLTIKMPPAEIRGIDRLQRRAKRTSRAATVRLGLRLLARALDRRDARQKIA